MSEPMDPAIVEAMLDRLTNYPADGQPPNDDTTRALILCGFIARVEVNKSCSTCGAMRRDYSWLKITAGGRAFVAAAQRAPA
jgi:hypothetical protein